MNTLTNGSPRLFILQPVAWFEANYDIIGERRGGKGGYFLASEFTIHSLIQDKAIFL